MMNMMNNFMSAANHPRSGSQIMSMHCPPFSRQEFWIGWGLVICARVLGFESGEKMWEKKTKTNKVKLTNEISEFEPHEFMQLHQFRQWKKAVSYSFADPECKKMTQDGK